MEEMLDRMPQIMQQNAEDNKHLTVICIVKTLHRLYLVCITGAETSRGQAPVFV